MTKKREIPLWALNAALAALQNIAYWQSCELARAKYRDTGAEEAWTRAHDAWLKQHPRPESAGRIAAKRAAFKVALEKKAARKVKRIYRDAKAGKLTAAQLLKAVETF